MRTAIYPGSFDPVTNGHIDILQRALTLFDAVIITVANNSTKNPLFTEEERVALLQEATKKFKNVEVEAFHGCLVDYVQETRSDCDRSRLRAVTDFEYEFQMALMNRKLNEKIETIFIMPNEKYTYLSSNFVREIASSAAAWRSSNNRNPSRFFPFLFVRK